MKYLINIGLGLFISSMVCCQSNQKFDKVSDSEIDKERLEFATKLASKIITAQKEGGFYDLSEDEADAAMISGLNESIQKQAYKQIKGMFCDYQSLVFDHLMKSTEGTIYEIYRFKGQFESSEAEVEIRVVLNTEGKLAGYFIKPWKEDL